MISTTFVSLLFGATVVLASPTADHSECGGFISDADFAAAESHFTTTLAARAANANITAPAADGATRTTQINLFWHVIYQKDSPSGATNDAGYLSVDDIINQVNVLNNGVGQLGVQFVLNTPDYTRSKQWYSKADRGNSNNNAMKIALRQGDEADFNVYSVGFGSKAMSKRGYSTYPKDVNNNLNDDGSVINFRTLPGGTYPGFSGGHTLIHEAGHWLGLYDTAQGGCGKTGDGVSDTSSEKTPATGCPRNGRDTCSNGQGPDPIHNFMDGTNDQCTTDFTSGQGKRVRQQIAAFRDL
ncbi:metalloprotease [Mycena crocata]|nr:metalloprotease [Mycena crocata]